MERLEGLANSAADQQPPDPAQHPPRGGRTTVSPREAAEALGIPVAQLTLIPRSSLTPIRIGSRILYLRDQLDGILEGRTRRLRARGRMQVQAR